MKRRVCVLLLFGIATSTTSETRAEPVTFFFEGYIDSLTDFGLDDSVAIGTPFSGAYVFDPAATADSSPDNPHFGFYGFPGPSRLSVAVGDYEFVTYDLLITVVDDALIGDGYFVRSWTSPFLSEGIVWYDMAIGLLDTTRTALDSDELPLTPPELGAFPTYTVFSASIPGHLGEVIGGPLTLLTPEPSSLAIVGLGAVIIMSRRERGERR